VPITNNTSEKTPWYHSFFNRRKASGNAARDTLLDDLSAPSQTVCTNAWAGTSQSRGSTEYSVGPSSPGAKDFIRVKQVIHQQSEIEL
jgi:pheromone a factor receptor